MIQLAYSRALFRLPLRSYIWEELSLRPDLWPRTPEREEPLLVIPTHDPSQGRHLGYGIAHGTSACMGLPSLVRFQEASNTGSL